MFQDMFFLKDKLLWLLIFHHGLHRNPLKFGQCLQTYEMAIVRTMVGICQWLLKVRFCQFGGHGSSPL